MQTIKTVVSNTKKIYLSSNAIEQLMDFERVLDSLNLYVFDHWINGELIEGPVIKKYFVSCKFMWPYHRMPDPSGAEKLLKYDINITYQKDILERPVEVTEPSDFEEGTKYPKMVKSKIWIVEIEMPKKLMSDIKRGSVEVEDEDIDMSDLEKAYDNDVEEDSYKIDQTQGMPQGDMGAGQPAGQQPGGGLAGAASPMGSVPGQEAQRPM